MNSLMLIAVLVGAASAQLSPFSGGFGGFSGGSLSPFSGSGLGAYGSYRPFSGFGGASSLSSLYGGSPSLYGSASTSHPYAAPAYGSSPYAAASSGPYSSGPYTTSFSSHPQYSASLGSPHTMSKDPVAPNFQSSPSSAYERLPGMGGGGLISNLFRNRRPSLFGFRRGQPAAQSQHSRLRPQNPLQAPAAGNFLYHPLPEPPYYPPYSYPSPGRYSGHQDHGALPPPPPNQNYSRDQEHGPPARALDQDQY